MSKLDEYKERKRVEALGLPKVFVVKSTRKGVVFIEDVQVIEIKKGGTRSHLNSDDKWENVRLFTYKLDVSPYEIDIPEGAISGINSGYGSGFGDLWAWTNYVSLDKDDALAYAEKEEKRIENKYLGLKVLILKSPDGDWEGLFVNGNLIDEGHHLGEGTSPAIYWVKQSENYDFKSSDIRIKSIEEGSEDAEYLESLGSFPNQLSDLKGKY